MTEAYLPDVLAYRDTIHKLREKGRDRFFPWFDGGKDMCDAFARARHTYITMIRYFSDRYMLTTPLLGTSLDIGYGGGGQVLCACRIFRWVVGIDVHEESAFVKEELQSRGSDNFSLLTCNGSVFPVMSKSISFAHSWSVFMHLGTMYAVRTYLKEIHRVLLTGGVAVIYFSRLVRTKTNQDVNEYGRDLLTEQLIKIGYNEKKDVPVNQINLRISLWRMSEEAKEAGFEILERTMSHTKDERGNIVIGGQHGIVLRKKND